MAKKSLRYRLADVGFFTGAAASIVYGVATADGEGTDYIQNVIKNIGSEPIMAFTISSLYIGGGIGDFLFKERS